MADLLRRRYLVEVDEICQTGEKIPGVFGIGVDQVAHRQFQGAEVFEEGGPEMWDIAFSETS